MKPTSAPYNAFQSSGDRLLKFQRFLLWEYLVKEFKHNGVQYTLKPVARWFDPFAVVISDIECQVNRLISRSTYYIVYLTPNGCYLNLWTLYLVIYSPGTSQQLNGILNLVLRLKYWIVSVQDDRDDRTNNLAFHRDSPNIEVVRMIHCNHTINAVLLHNQALKVSFTCAQEFICMYIPI